MKTRPSCSAVLLRRPSLIGLSSAKGLFSSLPWAHSLRRFALFLLLLLTGLRMTAAQSSLIHFQFDGLAYDPFRDGQSPDLGIFPSPNQMIEDMHLIHPLARRIRTYGSSGALSVIPLLARANGLKCYAGAYISKNESANVAEIEALLVAGKRAHPAALIFENEAVSRGDVSVSYIQSLVHTLHSKTSLPIGCAEPWAVWLAHPEIASDLDVILVHVHPYYDSIPVENAADYVYQRWRQIKDQHPLQKVELGEIGWPSFGPSNGSAVPSEENQSRFISEFAQIATSNSIPYFFFQFANAAWKTNSGANPVEANWGISDSGRVLKSDVQTFIESPPVMVDIQTIPKCGTTALSRMRVTGRVYGIPAQHAAAYQIVLYSHTDLWYVQPWDWLFQMPVNGPRAQWSISTHLGFQYGALLTKAGWVDRAAHGIIVARPDLPALGTNIYAKSIADCNASAR